MIPTGFESLGDGKGMDYKIREQNMFHEIVYLR